MNFSQQHHKENKYWQNWSQLQIITHSCDISQHDEGQLEKN